MSNLLQRIFGESELLISGEAVYCQQQPQRSQKKLESALKLYSNQIDEIITQLDELLEINRDSEDGITMLDKLMLPIKILEDESHTVTSITSTTATAALGMNPNHLLKFNNFNDNDLIKLLLKIEKIQSSLIHSLLQAIVFKVNLLQSTASAASATAAASGYNGSNDNEKCNNLRYSALNIFNHVRWCDVIYHPMELVHLLTTAVIPAVMDISFKIEMISTLPTICLDAHHSSLVEKLIEYITYDPELIPCVFDTISNLNISKHSSAMTHAIEAAKELLSSADDKELPVIVRFLLDSIHDKESGKAVMEQLRLKISEYITSHDDGHSSSFLSCVSLLLNAIKSSFMINDMLFLLYHELLSLPDSSQFVIIDLWMCITLYSVNRFRPKLQAMLLRGYTLNKLSFYDSLVSYSNILEADYPNLLSLCQAMLTMPAIASHKILSSLSLRERKKRSSSYLSQNILLSGIAWEANHLLAFELYWIVYCEFSNASYRQDLIASVIRHISSHQHPSESTMALYLLQCIAELEYAVMLAASAASPQLQQSQLQEHISTQETFDLLLAHVIIDVSIVMRLKELLLDQSQTSTAAATAAHLPSFVSFILTLLQEIQYYSNRQISAIFYVLFLISFNQSSIEKLCESLTVPPPLLPPSRTSETANVTDTIAEMAMAMAEEEETQLPLIDTAAISSRPVFDRDSLQGYLPDDIMIYLMKYQHYFDLKHRKIAILGYLACVLVIPYHISAPSVGKILCNHIYDTLIEITRNDSVLEAFLLQELVQYIQTQYIRHHVLIRIVDYCDDKLQGFICYSLAEYQDSGRRWRHFFETANHLSSSSSGEKSYCSLSHGLCIYSSGGSSSSGSIQHHYPSMAVSQGAHLQQQDIMYISILDRILAIVSSAPSSSSSSSSRQQQQQRLSPSLLAETKVVMSLLPYYLHVLASCHYKIHRHLDEIGSLLYLPIQLPKESLLSTISSYDDRSQFILCCSVFYTVNYVREVVNSFMFLPAGPHPGAQREEEIQPNSVLVLDIEKGRLIHRLNSLLALERQLIILYQSGGRETLSPLMSLPQPSTAVPKKRSSKAATAAAKKVTLAVEEDSQGGLLPAEDGSQSISAIEAALEREFRPLYSYVVVALGFDWKDYAVLYPTDTLRSVDGTGTAAATTVHLEQEVILRLLQILSAALRVYSSPNSFPSPSPASPDSVMVAFSDIVSYQSLDYVHSLHLHLGGFTEYQYYGILHSFHVYRGLAAFLTLFLNSIPPTAAGDDTATAAFGGISQISMASQHDLDDSGGCHATAAAAAIFDIDISLLPVTGGHQELLQESSPSSGRPEELLSTVYLICTVINASLASKALINELTDHIHNSCSCPPGETAIPAAVPLLIRILEQLFPAISHPTDGITIRYSTAIAQSFEQLYLISYRLLQQLQQLSGSGSSGEAVVYYELIMISLANLSRLYELHDLLSQGIPLTRVAMTSIAALIAAAEEEEGEEGSDSEEETEAEGGSRRQYLSAHRQLSAKFFTITKLVLSKPSFFVHGGKTRILRDLSTVLGYHLKSSSYDPSKKLSLLYSFSASIFPDQLDKEDGSGDGEGMEDDHSSSQRRRTAANGGYDSLCDGSLIVYYQAILAEVYDVFLVYTGQQQQPSKGSASSGLNSSSVQYYERDMTQTKLLGYLTLIIKTYRNLIILTKHDNCNNKTTLLLHALRGSNRFLTCFLSALEASGILYEFLKGNQPRQIVSLFRILQTATRQLQPLCSHTKVLREKLPAKEVPKLKKLLEKLIFRIHGLIRETASLSDFALKVSSLKSRNIDGSAAVVVDTETEQQLQSSQEVDQSRRTTVTADGEDDGEGVTATSAAKPSQVSLSALLNSSIQMVVPPPTTQKKTARPLNGSISSSSKFSPPPPPSAPPASNRSNKSDVSVINMSKRSFSLPQDEEEEEENSDEKAAAEMAELFYQNPTIRHSLATAGSGRDGRDDEISLGSSHKRTAKKRESSSERSKPSKRQKKTAKRQIESDSEVETQLPEEEDDDDGGLKLDEWIDTMEQDEGQDSEEGDDDDDVMSDDDMASEGEEEDEEDEELYKIDFALQSYKKTSKNQSKRLHKSNKKIIDSDED